MSDVVNKKRRKRIAIIGSSGGGRSTLGDTYALISKLLIELNRALVDVAAIQVVECEVPLDFAQTSTPSILWGVNIASNQVQMQERGPLGEINRKTPEYDRRIAAMILEGDVDGLISISADVEGVNQRVFRAAATKQIPVIGTGGTSLGLAAENNCLIIGNSGGSVATTIQGKALAFTASLAMYWKLSYEPQIIFPSLHSCLAGCLPAFIAIMILLKIQQQQLGGWLLSEDIIKHVSSKILPLVVCVVVSSESSGNIGLTAVIAGSLAAGLIVESEGTEITLLLGALTGSLSGFFCQRILLLTAQSLLIPATASSIITAGASGVLAGLICSNRYLLGGLPRLTSFAYTILRSILFYLENPQASLFFHMLVGILIGGSMCYGSKVGLYHLIFLPLICLEMAEGEASFLGAVDFCSLCLVSAGFCLGFYLLPPPNLKHNLIPLAGRGVFINLLFGDFVEACYPFLRQDWLLQSTAYGTSILSSILLLRAGAKSSAYLPFFLSLWIADGKASYAALVAFTIPFCVSILRNLMLRFLS